jgi:nicotinamidase-related amidase
VPVIHEHARMLARLDLLIHAARTLGVPVLVTEQYPQGLGPTVAAVRDALPVHEPVVKTDFSCAGVPEFDSRLAALGRDQIVIAGIEAHVCVAQSALGLAARGGAVFVAADAVSSRRAFDAETALRRLDRAGVGVTTAEAVVFEWLRRAGTSEFKAVQQKIKAAA